ncbi:MAG: GNAT family N-acetyltransferase [bacterium]|nr:GNAT family N-acetyltransferase [bacterium]
MTIRPATDKDIPELMKMLTRHEEYVYLKRMKEMMRGESVQLVAEDDGHVVGQVFLTYYGKSTYPMYPDIRDMHVHDGKRSNGIGTEFIGVCEELSRLKGFNRIGLAVNPKLNPRARRLYERLRYIPTGDEPYLDGVYDGIEEWVIDMVKKI